MFEINGIQWIISRVPSGSAFLMRSDGSETLGVTDNNLKTIFLNNKLRGYMLDKVLCHELTHVYSFENHCNFDIKTEEIVADFMSLFGRNIIYMLDDLIKILNRVA